MKLSNNFTLKEMTRTMYDQFQEGNRKAVTPTILNTLKALCTTILQPIRDHFGLIIDVSSGFRYGPLNQEVGGDDVSQHLYGEAADFSVRGLDCNQGSDAVFQWIYKLSGIKFGQLVHETKPNSIWIHVSLGEPYRSSADCGQVFRYKNGVYRPVQV